jgi:hypothetical protein
MTYADEGAIRRRGRSTLQVYVHTSPFIPANPSMRSSIRRGAHCPMDRRPFFFSSEFSYLRVPKKPRLGGLRRFGDQLSQKSLATRTFIVQNGSCVV